MSSSSRRRPSRKASSRPWLHAETLESRDTPARITVTTTLDCGVGSLRWAIDQADSTPGTDRIVFSLKTTDPGFVDLNSDGKFESGDYWVISPTSALPAVTAAVLIDGWSQPQFRTNAPVIDLNGALAGPETDGLDLVCHDGSTVRGLAINGFGGNGIGIFGGGHHTITGDFIGTDVSGFCDMGNGVAGIFVADSNSNTIGGTSAASHNLISGNDFQGIHMEGSYSNKIQGNLIGTTVTGDTALANGSAVYYGDGIRIEGGGNNVIGGTNAAVRNVLSGNFDDGIDIRDGSCDNTVQGNYIGTNAQGTGNVGNGADGVYLQDAVENLVGGLVSGDANTIGNNGYNGVFLYGDSHNNNIAGNFIGTNRGGVLHLGNGTVASFADGIFMAQFGTPQGPWDNTIARNVIAFNADSGISMDVTTSANEFGDTFTQNAIFGNTSDAGGAAIDFASDGMTPNDLGDPDTGPNGLQNFPVLSPTTASQGQNRIVTGTLDSTPNTKFRIEFFASAAPGEGAVFLGSVNVTTGAGGLSPTFQFRFHAVAGFSSITSTATNLTTGDTSEFSAPVV